MSKRRLVVVLLGLVVSAAFVYLALRGIDFAAVEHAFTTAHLLPWVPLALGIYAIGYFLRGVRCRLLIKNHAEISTMGATNVVVVGYAANNVLPARLGELVRAGMLAERAKMPVSQSLGVTFVERVLDGLVLLLMLVLATFTGTVPTWMSEVVYVAMGVFGIATVVMVVGALWPRVIITLAGKVGGVLGTTWRDRFVKLATNVTNAGASLRNPKQAALLILYSCVIWCFEASLYVLLLGVFDIPISIQSGVITMCVTGFMLLLPSSPGFIGPFHYFASQALMIHGVAQPTALAYATLVHLCFYIPITVWGASAMMWYGVELSATAARAQREAAAAAAAEPEPDVEAA